jgi:HK97 family phage major capsid protein
MSKKLRRNKVARSGRGNLPALVEERKGVFVELKRMQQLLGERRVKSKTDPDTVPEFTAEEEGKWQKLSHRIDTIDDHIDRERRMEKLERRFTDVDPDDYGIGRDDFRPGKSKRARKEEKLSDEACRAAALQAWLFRMAGKPLDRVHVRACQRFNFNPSTRSIDMLLTGTERFARMQDHFQQHAPKIAAKNIRQELRDLRDDREERMLTSIGPVQQGPALVGETFMTILEIAMLTTSSILEVADVIDTDGGEPMHWPTADDSTNEGTIVGEGKSLGTATDPTFGRQTWGAFKYSSKPVLVTSELLEDSFVDLPRLIPQMQGERLGRILNRHATLGNGTTEPEGFMTSAAAGATAASATAISYGDVINLIDSVDESFEPNASFQMNKAIRTYLRKLTDADGRPIWADNWREGVPSTLLGYTVRTNSYMDSTVAATKKTIAFGDFSKLKVRRVRAVRNLRLNEKYVVEYDAIGFLSLMRMDAKVLGANFAAASKPIKYLLQS